MNFAMSPTSSSRSLGNLEVFFKKLVDLGAFLEREHWAVHLSLRLQVKEQVDLITYLRKTWQTVRLEHSAIGSTIEPYQSLEAQDKAEDRTRAV